MEQTSVTINWNTFIAVLFAAVGPTVTGFLQQFSKDWIAKAPWWAKGLISSAVSAIIGMIGAVTLDGEAAMASAGGAVVGAIGAMNIAFRKGSRGNLEAVTCPKVDK